MKNIITNIDSRSPLSEEIKTLRTNLQFMKPTKGLQSILVTSTLPEEGKSWVTSNLGVAFAQAGKRTVIIDSDMRKGTMHYLFDIMLTPGLSNYLSGVNLDESSTISDVIQKTEIENLSVITSGDIPPNPSELLLNEKMENLLKELENIADVVIFDGTPSMLVTDSIILSRLVNSTIIIAEYNKTKMNNLKQVKEDIEKVGGKVSGVVLNKIPNKGKEYGYGYGYGYGYYGLPVVSKKVNILSGIKNVFSKTGKALAVFCKKIGKGFSKVKKNIVRFSKKARIKVLKGSRIAWRNIKKIAKVIREKINQEIEKNKEKKLEKKANERIKAVEKIRGEMELKKQELKDLEGESDDRFSRSYFTKYR